MTITNQHVGWSILVIILLIPWVPVVFYGAEVFPYTTSWYVAIGVFMRLIETIVAGLLGALIAIAIIVQPFFWISELISGEREFTWHINLPKFNGKSPKHSRDHALFLKLGTLDQNSPEWLEIYNDLNRRGKWG